MNKLANIFVPRINKATQEIKDHKKRFVHYTSAHAAMQILKSREIWMRDTTCMNDYTEVDHGINCVVGAYKSERAGRAFKEALNTVHEGITNEIESLFDGWLPALRTDTYLTCISEHLDSEDLHGRLSMWRAYCGTTGVAIVLSSNAFFDGPGLLKAYACPVAYLNDDQFGKELIQVTKSIVEEKDFLRAQKRESIKSAVFNALRFAAVSTKHKVFEEEKEWRIIHCPSLESSKYVEKHVESINGAPQIVYKIPLKNHPEVGLTGGELNDLVDRIIIGPTQYSMALWKAFVLLLQNAGVADAEKKVHISNIPLR